MKKFLVACFILSLVSVNIVCTKPAVEKPGVNIQNNSDNNIASAATRAVVYKIRKGENYCTPNPFVFTSASELNFTAVFDSSCIYATKDPVNQNDINKLFGFSDCNTHHLENSARVGWRWSKDSLRIFAFVHNDGVMLSKEIATAAIGAAIHCNITCLSNTYTFRVNKKTVELPRHCSGNYNRYKLYPYFGGDETAPHNIKIKLKEL